MSETLINILLSLAFAVGAFLVGGLTVAFAVYRLALGDAFYVVVIGCGLAAGILVFTFSFRKLRNP